MREKIFFIDRNKEDFLNSPDFLTQFPKLKIIFSITVSLKVFHLET